MNRLKPARLLQFTLLFTFFSQPLFSGAWYWDIARNGQRVQRKWSTPNVRWRYNPSNAPTGTQEIIQNAFQTWEVQSSSTIADTYEGTTDNTGPLSDGYSDIFFNVSMASVGAPPNAIAVTLLNSTRALPTTSSQSTIVEADILINPAIVAELTTSPSSDPSDLDLQEILTHEIGHAYGLAHSFLVDSMMYLSKPASDTSPTIKNLFRAPKRSLAQDDIAWISMLYPASHFEQSTSQISGQVTYNNNAYTGAHVIAVKTDESDFSVNFVNLTTGQFVVVKGMKNVSAFSEVDGKFLIKGLEPGNYKILTQNGASFMGFSLSNVNTYLSTYQSSESFPFQFWTNPDCTDGSIATASNYSTYYTTASDFSVAANQGYCGIDVAAHTGASNSCRSNAFPADRCDGGGGCSLSAQPTPLTNAFVLPLALFLFALFCARKKSN